MRKQTNRDIEGGAMKLKSEVDVMDYNRIKAEYLELQEQICAMEYTDPQRYAKKIKARAIGERILRMIFKVKASGCKYDRENGVCVIMPVLSIVVRENIRMNAHLPAYKKEEHYLQAMANVLESAAFDHLDPVNKFVLQIGDDCGIDIVEMARKIER